MTLNYLIHRRCVPFNGYPSLQSSSDAHVARRHSVTQLDHQMPLALDPRTAGEEAAPVVCVRDSLSMSCLTLPVIAWNLLVPRVERYSSIVLPSSLRLLLLGVRGETLPTHQSSRLGCLTTLRVVPTYQAKTQRRSLVRLQFSQLIHK